ncbi:MULTISPECIES: DUF4139 domain-containing protein [unclassified Lentimicrobium]|uniref:DUF4139 domain-containing protein n=1 Tax=unclassified Lentimicrobium TaxID=2677434 RepID=UPI0015533A1F|nr:MULTISPECIES: DUF4139 domain-containing protein [unclassified Lentimicrobium]NPD45372.1 mucoidy inhibitor MuiA family protein [Lentimicrobium sp. S6]NPD85261.1 mucoidy inhibitor MuiA family protein [Lentimicrobium sp. L6]
MKNILFLFLSLFTFGAFAQGSDTLIAESKIKEVNLFFSGAEVSREVTFNAKKGKQLLLVDELPVQFNHQSLLVSNVKNAKILSVKLENGRSKKVDDRAQIKAIELEIKNLKQKIKDNRIEKQVFQMEKDFILNNGVLGGDKGATIAEIKAGAEFYRTKLTEISKKVSALDLELDNIKEEIVDLDNKRSKIKMEGSKEYSQVYILLENEKEVLKQTFKLSYYLTAAAWEPVYDFRVKELGEPLAIDYNAIIYQNSGEDWKEVALTLSTSDPSLGSAKPELEDWFIDKRKAKENKYNSTVLGTEKNASLKGQLVDAETYEPVPFTNVILEYNGTQIAGTSTDFDGNYTMKPIPNGVFTLKASTIGYQPVIVEYVIVEEGKINFLDVEMNSREINLDAVEIIAYEVPLISKDETTTGGTFSFNDDARRPNRNASSVVTTVGGVNLSDRSKGSNSSIITENYLTENVKQKLSNLEYEVKTPFTVLSDGKDYSLKIKEVKVPVDYVYYAIPKLDDDVFLTAQIPNWTDLNLLSGKSNIYYSGTYVGESYISDSYAGDTLDVSLGRDRDIMVTRKGNKERLERKVLGKSILETLSWDIEVKNNKNTAVKVILEDQFPLAINQNIEIELIEVSGAKSEPKTGKLTWDLELEPKASVELQVTYTVRYPKYSKLYLD